MHIRAWVRRIRPKSHRIWPKQSRPRIPVSELIVPLFSRLCCFSRRYATFDSLSTDSTRVNTAQTPRNSPMATLRIRRFWKWSSSICELYRLPMLSKGQGILWVLCAVFLNNIRSQIGLVLVGRHVFTESLPSIFEGAILVESAALGAV